MIKVYLTLFFCCILTALSAQNTPVAIHVPSGHAASVTNLIVSQDGQLLVSASNDQSIIIWEFASGKEIRKIECRDFIKSIDISADGTLIAVVLENGSTQIYQMLDGELAHTLLPPKGYFNTAKFTPDGASLILSSSESIQFWSLKSKSITSSIAIGPFYCNHNCQRNMTISPDGKWTVIATSKGELNVINNRKEALSFTIAAPTQGRLSHGAAIASSFAPDSKSFIVGSELHGITQYYTNQTQNPDTLLRPQLVTSGLLFQMNDLSISPNGKKLAALYYNGVQDKFNREDFRNLHTFDLTTKQLISSIEIQTEEKSSCLLWQPSSDQLIVGAGKSPALIQQESGELIREFEGFLTAQVASNWIKNITPKHLYHNINQVIERSGNKVILWNLRTGKTIRTIWSAQDRILAMSQSKDQKYLFVSSADKQWAMVEIATGNILWQKEVSFPIMALDQSNDTQKMIAIHLGGQISVWNASDGKYEKNLAYSRTDGHLTPIHLGFTKHGLLAYGNFLMNTDTGEKIAVFDNHTGRIFAITMSKDQQWMLTSGWDGQTYLRELSFGAAPQLIGQKIDSRVYCAAFSLEENLISTGAADNNVRVYRKNGQLLYTLSGHKAGIISVSFDHTGNYLISGSMDGTTKLWDLTTGKLKYTHILLDEDNWTVTMPSGDFYATQKSTSSMYFVRGTETYDLLQFFDEYYKPEITENLLSLDVSASSPLSDQLATAPPPEIEIVYPTSTIINEEETSVMLKVTDTGGGVSDIRLYQNGKNVFQSAATYTIKKGNTHVKTYKVTLVPGSNHLEAIAYNQANLASKPATTNIINETGQAAVTCHVLSIGINQYTNSKLNLNYALNDAKGFTDIVQKRGANLYDKILTYTLYDSMATRDNILLMLDSLADVVRPNDVFIFYYAGHGSLLSDEFYFVPTNCPRLYDDSTLNEQALSVSAVANRFKNIAALKQVIFLDACHSGSSTSALAVRGALEEKAIAHLSRSAGVHVLAASGSDQSAIEFEALGHGIFTYAVLEALDGKADGAPADRKVTVFELKSYLDDLVPKYTQQYKNQAQYPNTYSVGHNFPITIIH